MARELDQYLRDIREACDAIEREAGQVALEDYLANAPLRAAVERRMITIGEAATHIRRLSPDAAAAINDCDQIVALRNLLVHQYWLIDDRITWSVVQTDIARLRHDVDQLLSTGGADQSDPAAT